MSDQIPTISVLMPVYNAEQFLAQAIDSVLAQTLSEFELLIINDGSRDGSRAILDAYTVKDDRIRVTHRSNQGIVATLNELLAQAQGEFIARMDADDVAMPDRFIVQVAFLRQHPEVLCVGGAYAMIDAQGTLLTIVNPPPQDAEIQDRLLSGRTAIQHPCAMVRRSALLQVGGYNPQAFLAEDLDLWLRLGEIGKLANLADTVLYYRVHDRSLSARRIKRQNQVVKWVCQQAWQRRGVPKRACADAVLRHQQHMVECGRRSLAQGQHQDALRYGIKAVTTRLLSLASWRLLVRAALKLLRQSIHYE